MTNTIEKTDTDQHACQCTDNGGTCNCTHCTCNTDPVTNTERDTDAKQHTCQCTNNGGTCNCTHCTCNTDPVTNPA